MLTENIAKDAALLISEQMLYVVQATTYLIKDKQLEQFQRASNLWHCIKREFQATEVARNISLDMEATPDNEIVQAIFRHQLSKHLKQDDDFAWNIEQILYVQDFRPIRKTAPQTKRRSAQEFVPVANEQHNPQVVPPTLVTINPQTIERVQDTQHSGD